MKLEPRWYQGEAVERVTAWIKDEWQPGKRGVVSLPTGSGKTIIFSMLSEQFFSLGQPNILILAHRKELVLQAEAKLKAIWPEAPVGVYSASADRREIRPITIASRGTFINADLTQPFHVCFVDEAHNIAADEDTQYQKIFAKLEEVNPSMVTVGLTATAYRRGSGLIYGEDQPFSDLIYEVPLKRLIEEGFLCPLVPKQTGDAGQISVEGLRKYHGDFAMRALAERADQQDLITAALDEWREHAWNTGRRSTCVFAVNISHGEHIATQIRERYGIPCEIVTGKTSKSDRERILRRFDAGRLPVVVNVGVLTEGWDCPRLDCILLMRPTWSLGLYIQMVGRGFRTHEEKENTLVLDFGGNAQRFGPIDVARPPASGNRKEEPRTKVCEHCKTINKPFASKCEHCDTPFPCGEGVIRCPGCNEENSRTAIRCWNCNYQLIKQEAEASAADLISSDEPKLQWYTVDQVTVASRTSKSGNQYVRVDFMVNLTQSFFLNLMIGFSGKYGTKAIERWRALTVPGTPEPACPAEAVDQCINGHLRKVRAIQVDLNSKYRDIKQISFEEAQ